MNHRLLPCAATLVFALCGLAPVALAETPESPELLETAETVETVETAETAAPADSTAEAADVTHQGVAPDLREDKPPLTVGKGNFVVVPIPFSNPTLDTGLVAGAAWFHAQSEAEKKVQPPSITGVAAMGSSNGSKAAAVGHMGYWKEDRWRFTGVYAQADLLLPLLAPGDVAGVDQVDWSIEGGFFQASLARRVGSRWFVGATFRYIDIEQTFGVDLPSAAFDLDSSIQSAGLGIDLSYDTRDMTTNAYEGRYFKVTAQFNSESLGSDETYQAFNINYKQYHLLRDNWGLAWEVAGCSRSDGVPLWDACQIGLRGFAATDYLGKSSMRAQAESRWFLSERWGAVAFAGAGQLAESFAGNRDHDIIPSYGVGIRFAVQKSNRVNLRLDYARSRDSNAFILSVMEAF